jgi:hypothetical protein
MIQLQGLLKIKLSFNRLNSHLICSIIRRIIEVRVYHLQACAELLDRPRVHEDRIFIYSYSGHILKYEVLCAPRSWIILSMESAPSRRWITLFEVIS